jgi:hypothetical protein
LNKITAPPNYINHIVLVIDASGSMYHRTNEVIKVADNQIKYLATRSKELDQETRITVYVFSSHDQIKCLIYDKDVLRVPSIAGLYYANGTTALVDATLLAISDLKMTPEKYGEHSFLIYVLTDGRENDSRGTNSQLVKEIDGLLGHWTLAAFVPDQIGVHEAKKFGFPAENVAIWNTNAADGLAEVGETIKRTSETFMINRTKGIRGTKSLFKLNKVSVSDIVSSLTPVYKYSYSFHNVLFDGRIDEFYLDRLGMGYQVGSGYYQLTKKETIQPQKKVAILVNSTGVLYSGNARELLGLPDEKVDVKPEDYKDYTIFVQSTSVNRKLIAGTRLLYYPG